MKYGIWYEHPFRGGGSGWCYDPQIYPVAQDSFAQWEDINEAYGQLEKVWLRHNTLAQYRDRYTVREMP